MSILSRRPPTDDVLAGDCDLAITASAPQGAIAPRWLALKKGSHMRKRHSLTAHWLLLTALAGSAAFGCGDSATVPEQGSEEGVGINQAAVDNSQYLNTTAEIFSFGNDALEVFAVAYPQLGVAAGAARVLASFLDITSTEDVMAAQFATISAQLSAVTNLIGESDWHQAEMAAAETCSELETLQQKLYYWHQDYGGTPLDLSLHRGNEIDTTSLNAVNYFSSDELYYWPTAPARSWPPTQFNGRQRYYDWRLALPRLANSIVQRVITMQAIHPDFQVSGYYRDELLRYRDEIHKRFNEILSHTTYCAVDQPGPVIVTDPTTVHYRCRSYYTGEVIDLGHVASEATMMNARTTLTKNYGLTPLLGLAARLESLANGFDLPLNTPDPNWSVVATTDFDGNGKLDLVWRRSDDTGEPHIWVLDSAGRAARDIKLAAPDPGWRICGVGDFDRNGTPDLVWRRSDDTREARIWFLDSNGTKIADEPVWASNPISGWRVLGVKDFTGDGVPDLLWRLSNETHEAHIWVMTSGGQLSPNVPVPDIRLPEPDANMRIYGVADFDGNGTSDLVWRRTDDTGQPEIWLLNTTGTRTNRIVLPMADNGWRIYGTGDFDGNGVADLIWRRTNDTSEARVWYLNSSGGFMGQNGLPAAGADWRVIGVGDFLSDGRADILWRRSNDTAEPRIWWRSPGMALN